MTAVAKCDGRVCSGSMDGSIRVWSMTTEAVDRDAPERTLVHGGDVDPVFALSVWQDRLISGHQSGEVRVWDVETLTCEHTLRQASERGVWCLAEAGGEVWGGGGSSVVVWGRD